MWLPLWNKDIIIIIIIIIIIMQVGMCVSARQRNTGWLTTVPGVVGLCVNRRDPGPASTVDIW